MSSLFLALSSPNVGKIMYSGDHAMIKNLILVFIIVTLTGCSMMQSNLVALPTPLPTFTPALQTTSDPNITQAAALGGKQNGELYVWIYSNPNPPIRGENVFEAVVTDANGQPVTDAKISFDFDMINMSHGKNIVEATPLGEGHYAGKVHFLMPGPWRVIVAIERSEQTSTIRYDFNVNFQ
jgi:hypothetical protein